MPSPSAWQQLLKGWLPGEDCKSHQAHQHASSFSKAGCLGTIASSTKPISMPAASQRLAAWRGLQVPPSPSACQQLLKGWLPWNNCRSHQLHQCINCCSRAGCQSYHAWPCWKGASSLIILLHVNEMWNNSLMLSSQIRDQVRQMDLQLIIPIEQPVFPSIFLTSCSRTAQLWKLLADEHDTIHKK